jgi:signal transduction histidine kinase
VNGPGFDGLPQRQSGDRNTIDTIPVGCALFTPDRRLQLFNRQFPELTCLSSDRLSIGLPFAQLMSALQQRPDTMAFQQERNNGRAIDVRTESLPSGGSITIVTDITRIRETEDALLLSRCAAEAAEAAKARFLASVSTGLRTPLVTILAETAALVRKEHRDDEAALAARTIETSARSLLSLVDAILELTRLETGRFDLANDCVDLPRLLRRILRRFDPQAAAAEITLVVDLPLGLPMIRADEARLRQVLSNLVANALAVTGPFGNVSVRVRRDWASGGLLLQVQDTGPGIPDDERERAFEPFPQQDAPDKRGRYSPALALYVGRILMRAHGGDLVLRSTPGQGTIVTLTIPTDRVMQDARPDTN